MLGIFCLLLLLVVITVYYFKTRNLHKYLAKLDGPSALPLLGSVLKFSGDTRSVINNIIDLTNTYKSPWKFWVGMTPYIIITDPEDAKIVMDNCLEKAHSYRMVESLLGKGLFTSSIEKWKKHRKVISSTFSMQILNSYVEIFSAHSKALTLTLRKHAGKEIFDVFPLLAEFSCDITCDTIMGRKTTEKSFSGNYARNLTRALELTYFRLFRPWLHPDLIWSMTSYSKQFNDISEKLLHFVSTLVSEKQLEYRETDNGSFADYPKKKVFLDHLTEIRNITNDWTHAELMEEVQTLAAAGVEGLAISPSFTLMMIAMNPEIQEKLYKEQETIFGDSEADVTSVHLNEMVYLEQVIKETLRLFPVVNGVGRYIDKDITIKSYTIPAGCQCIIGILHMHRNPKFWNNPLKFDPDRFLPEEATKRHPYCYLPFSAGPRNCIGFKHAMMAIKTVIAVILRNFKISTDVKNIEDIRSKLGITFKPTGGHRIALELRHRDW